MAPGPSRAKWARVNASKLPDRVKGHALWEDGVLPGAEVTFAAPARLRILVSGYPTQIGNGLWLERVGTGQYL